MRDAFGVEISKSLTENQVAGKVNNAARRYRTGAKQLRSLASPVSHDQRVAAKVHGAKTNLGISKAVPRGMDKAARMKWIGETIARNISRARANPPTPKPFEGPKQLPLFERRSTWSQTVKPSTQAKGLPKPKKPKEKP